MTGTFRDRWRKFAKDSSTRDIDKDAVARFVKTLYTAGLVAACDEARRDEKHTVNLLKVLGQQKQVDTPTSDAATVRRVARDAVALLRLLQSNTEAP